MKSWLTIRQDLVGDDLSAPIMWLDDMSEDDLFPSDDLNIDWVEEMDQEGAPILKDDSWGRDICIEVNGFYTMNYLAYWSLRLGGFVAWNGHRKRNAKVK